MIIKEYGTHKIEGMINEDNMARYALWASPIA